MKKRLLSETQIRRMKELADLSEFDEDELDSWENYESGPFCQHYSDPSECEEVCATCKHECRQHDNYHSDPGEQYCKATLGYKDEEAVYCSCEDFVDEEEEYG